MKENTNYQRCINYLNKIFKYINESFFNNELPAPVITIQSTPRSYGHFTPWKSWTVNNGITTQGQVEINIGAETLNRPIENTVATLIHECVHYYCYLHNIKDTSRNGTYHNKRFKEEAEKRGLIIEYDSRIGWSITSPNETLLDFCISYNLQDIYISRNGSYHIPAGGRKGTEGTNKTGNEPKKKGSNSIKWVCPACGMIARTTKECKIACMDCNKQLIKA